MRRRHRRTIESAKKCKEDSKRRREIEKKHHTKKWVYKAKIESKDQACTDTDTNQRQLRAKSKKTSMWIHKRRTDRVLMYQYLIGYYYNDTCQYTKIL